MKGFASKEIGWVEIVGGKVTHDNLFSNKLIRVKSLLEEDYEADVSSVRPSS